MASDGGTQPGLGDLSEGVMSFLRPGQIVWGSGPQHEDQQGRGP